MRCDVHEATADCRQGPLGGNHVDAAVVVDDDAAMRQPLGGMLGPGEQRRLRVDLGEQGRGGEGGHLDDAGEGRLAAAGVEDVVGGGAVGADPAAPADAARRHGAVAQLQLVHGVTAERVVDPHRALLAGAAADADVAAAVDRVGPVLPQGVADEVGEQPLGDAAAVDLAPPAAG